MVVRAEPAVKNAAVPPAGRYLDNSSPATAPTVKDPPTAR
jgi:hypothetical protein